ncbi:MAG: carbohydrate ABC transporter permease [Eubacteriales bacterium]|nr:carbohydrate ABC transporter permease [Eubacteriales bacterium]MDD3882679.1 carbohydrate ABC transporter permease [Eubacteriales bacterium]MDD4512749.1 carbohydrate ABC transporter permease [Eubacteriales bacterium]
MSNTPKTWHAKSFWERNRKSGGYLLRSTSKRAIVNILRALLMFGLCFMILQPILSKISISLMSEKDIYDTTVIVLPRNPTTLNYTLTSHLMSYPTALMNTILISFITAVLQVAACTLVGYGFARYDFPLKRIWFACVILVIIVPPQVISTSLHVNFRFFDVFGIFNAIQGQPLNLRKTITPYLLMSMTCMGLKDGLYIYMLRQYFRGVPKSLEEAAYVDGCGSLHTFVRVMLPDALPILTSCFLFAFVWQWTDIFYSNTFMGTATLLSGELSRIAMRLSQYMADTQNASGSSVSIARQQQIIGTGVLMSTFPLIILYIFAQRGFVESLSMTGIKM